MMKLTDFLNSYFPIGIIVEFNKNFNPNKEIKNTKWEQIFEEFEEFEELDASIDKYWKRIK